jgi:hypothetical protein
MCDLPRKCWLFQKRNREGFMGQVATYCRVSTDDQSCERQERDLRAFAKHAGHRIVAVFKETASGADNRRSERAKVLVPARAREIDAILVTDSADGAGAHKTSSKRSTICTAGKSASWLKRASASISTPPAAS